jgi:hypothetical protein
MFSVHDFENGGTGLMTAQTWNENDIRRLFEEQ